MLNKCGCDAMDELKRTIKFTIFSISAGIIQVIVFSIMESLLKCNYWVSYLTSLILSIIWNFTLNRKITFKSATNIPIAALKVGIFYLIFTPTSTYIGNYLVDIGINDYLVLAGTMLSNFILEYLYDRFFVFGKSIDTYGK